MKVMRISDWLAAAMKLSIIAAFVILLSACSNTVKVEHVEAFSIEIFSEKNKDGFYEQAGFKKVNSITALAENKNYTSSEIKMVVDYYDLDGKYVKSEIVHSKFSKSHITMVEDGDDRKKELQEPSTIIIPDDNLQNFRSSALSDDEKKQIKQHVLNLLDRL
ncbi:hypothetical protein AB4Z17_02560 [Paenibacillus sp. TAF43_2]|uniref:hypothetical protein n=1 Tax=Paenibacillus sp. TAF43_2 TaxID=3233069 RepID=UPI003F991039